MVYVILVGLFLGAAVWAFYQGRELEALRKDLSQLREHSQRQQNVLEVLVRSIQSEEKLNEFREKAGTVTDADEFNRMLQAYSVTSTGSNT